MMFVICRGLNDGQRGLCYASRDRVGRFYNRKLALEGMLVSSTIYSVSIWYLHSALFN